MPEIVKRLTRILKNNEILTPRAWRLNPTIEGMVLENSSREGGSLICKVASRQEVTLLCPVRVDSLGLAVFRQRLTRLPQFGAVDEKFLESGRKIGAGSQSKIRRRSVKS